MYVLLTLSGDFIIQNVTNELLCVAVAVIPLSERIIEWHFRGITVRRFGCFGFSCGMINALT